MLSHIPLPLAEVVRSMQYMSARNGGLVVDFRPIRSYAEVARGAPREERVRTVLDWIAFATDVALLNERTWRAAFVDTGDFAAFVHELRGYDQPMNGRHAAAFERLGVGYPGQLAGYADLADAIEAAGLRREAA
jgi:hypothetical protein